MSIITLLIITSFIYIIPLALCMFASYKAFKDGSTPGYVAITFLIAFVPLVNIFVGLLTFVEYIVIRLRDK